MSGDSEDDEDDYMSTKFLDDASAYENTRAEKTYSERRRDHLREQNRKGYIKPRAQLEKEAREEGLKKQMGEENKGMKMLMKMGFKKGMTLGKQGQSALSEPLAVELKHDRGGLGMASALKRKREEEVEEERDRIKKANMDPEDFRDLMAQRSKNAQVARRVVKGAYLIEKLDTAKEIAEHTLWALRPPEPKKEESDEKSDDPSPVVVEVDDDTDNDEEQEPEEVQALKALPPQEQLQRILDYLRLTHYYCFWCGAQYNDESDLNENCPGPEEANH